MVRSISWLGLLVALQAIILSAAQASSLSSEGSADMETIILQRVADPRVLAPEVSQALQALQGNEMLSVIVRLKTRANLAGMQERERRAQIQKVIRALQDKADMTQKPIRSLLNARRDRGKVSKLDYFWIFNGLAATTTRDVIEELASRPEVDRITLDATVLAPAFSHTAPSSDPEPNLLLVNAPALWGLGFQGQGVVVANLDTGVDLNHPDLINKWRGGANSWFDPNGQHGAPVDIAGNSSGHGTWTMGVMVGGDAGGSSVGVAPDAQWIAAKIFNDQGQARVSGIHAAFQWILDPDGDPGSEDTPHVVNNSWSYENPGCNLEFELDLEVLRTVGILPIFVAGNAGPLPGTSFSPGNNPAAFAVGAIDNQSQIFTDSSRGPSTCGGVQSVFPKMVAPGVDIRSTDLYGLYMSATGTSLAAPHVSGGLALLLSAYPNLTAAEQSAALLEGAMDLGLAGPDNDFGYGRLDLWAAYQTILPSTPTPPPSLYLSLANSGSYTVGAVVGVRDEDILHFDGSNFTMFFDGSDVGVSSLDLDAFAVVDEETILISFNNPATICGDVDDSDIVRFRAVSLGDDTAGIFTLFFDGSDVGLNTNGEDIDAIELLADGRLLISTSGAFSAPGLSGQARDEDVLIFTPTSLGSETSGSWDIYFDGSEAGLGDTPDEDVAGVAAAANGDLYLTTQGNFAAPDLIGANEDIFVCVSPLLGDATACTYTLYFDGSTFGLTENSIDAIDMP